MPKGRPHEYAGGGLIDSLRAKHDPHYQLAGKVEGIDSGAAIAIVSIAVYGTFMGAPATLGVVANNYGVNSIFFPILIIFLFVLPILFASKKNFK